MVRRVFLLIFLIAVLWAVGFVYYTTTLPRATPDDSRQADGIVVLTGGSIRLPEAIGLLEAGRGKRLLISGVNESIDDQRLKNSLGMTDGQDDALFQCCIDTGRDALDTVGNAAEIALWANKHDYASLLVVTASYHMPRSLLEIRRRAPLLTLVPHPVFPENVKVGAWWRYPGTARVLASEYNKYVVALVKAHALDPLVGAPAS